MAEESDEIFTKGETVSLKNMADASMDGSIGELVGLRGKDRWAVRLQGAERSVVVNARCLKKEKLQLGPRSAPQPCRFAIIGTWDDWDLHMMDWKEELRCFEYRVVVGSSGQESFKILAEADWDKCLHPNRHNANPHDGHVIEGPDDGDLDQQWTIGYHHKDEAPPGSCVTVRLLLHSDSTAAKQVTWEAPTPIKSALQAQAPTPVKPTLQSQAPPQEPEPKPETTNELTAPAEPLESSTETPDDVERVLQLEREARLRLVARLDRAARLELLPIEDDWNETLASRAASKELLTRRHKLDEAKRRFEEEYGRAKEERAGTQAAPIEEGPKSDRLCVDCGAPTQFLRCSKCLMLCLHKIHWTKDAPAARKPAFVPTPPPASGKDAFDLFWDFT